MKRQMEKLSQNHLEFHKYLKENESSLLNFDDGELDKDDEGGDYCVQDEDAMADMARTIANNADSKEGEEHCRSYS